MRLSQMGGDTQNGSFHYGNMILTYGILRFL